MFLCFFKFYSWYLNMPTKLHIVSPCFDMIFIRILINFSLSCTNMIHKFKKLKNLKLVKNLIVWGVFFTMTSTIISSVVEFVVKIVSFSLIFFFFFCEKNWMKCHFFRLGTKYLDFGNWRDVTFYIYKYVNLIKIK